MIAVDNTSKVSQAIAGGNWNAGYRNLARRLCDALAINHGGRIPDVVRGLGTARSVVHVPQGQVIEQWTWREMTMTEWESREPVTTEVNADEVIMLSATRMAALLNDLKAMVSQGIEDRETGRTWDPAELMALAERLEEERQTLLTVTRVRASTGTDLPATQPHGGHEARP